MEVEAAWAADGSLGEEPGVQPPHTHLNQDPVGLRSAVLVLPPSSIEPLVRFRQNSGG